NPWYEVTLFEGRNRQIRRMFEEVGHHVEKIKRVKLGPLELDVPPGSFRKLSPAEVEMLRRAAAGEVRVGRPLAHAAAVESRPAGGSRAARAVGERSSPARARAPVPTRDRATRRAQRSRRGKREAAR
ncbi:MAG: hypothetical protein L0212_11325, partial [Acidobacteria bacterium]|nr:hypothetical protein [Acidobacteriota bacterium]